MHRRTFVTTSLGLLAGTALTPLEATAQSAPSLRERARQMAREPYRAPSGELPPPFNDLDYDAYRAIRPLPGQAAFLGLGPRYSVDLLPPGLYFPEPVEIQFVRDDEVETKEFSPDLFSYDTEYFDDVPNAAPGAGFTGLRLRTEVNKRDVMDEFFVLQGGTYFRAIGQEMVYGLSTRAVAIGTGEPGEEEFPRFTLVRLHTPAQEGIVRLEAIIDSPSLTGYLDLYANAGAETVTRAKVSLFPRTDIPNVGIGALTSMFLKGPIRHAAADDYRPRVHDSDVLVVENGSGETIWRPISNPAANQTSTFSDAAPRSFGLYQTERRFTDFEDNEAHYHDRPSAQVRPRGEWGPGAVHLVEIATDTEFMDNIVAFWRPDAPLKAGEDYDFDYDVVWTRDAPAQDFPVQLVETRSGRKHDEPGVRTFVIDIAGDPGGLTPEIQANAGEVSDVVIFPLPEETGRHRMSFHLNPGEAEAVELRLTLRDRDGGEAAPIWLHRWTPGRDGGV